MLKRNTKYYTGIGRMWDVGTEPTPDLDWWGPGDDREAADEMKFKEL